MAGIAKKGDAYYCTFRYGGKRYYFTAGKVTEAQARARAAEADETLALIERGRLDVPAGVPLEDFVAAGGKVPVLSVRPETTPARQLFDHYLATMANGTVQFDIPGPETVDLKAAAVTTEPAGGLPQPSGGFALLGAL